VNARGTGLSLRRLRDYLILRLSYMWIQTPEKRNRFSVAALNLIMLVREYGKGFVNYASARVWIGFVNSMHSLPYSNVSLQGLRVSMQWRG
jgi:hypothetical protein